MPLFLTESPSYHNRELLEAQVQYLCDRVAGNEAEPGRTEGSCDGQIPIAVVKCRCANASGTPVSWLLGGGRWCRIQGGGEVAARYMSGGVVGVNRSGAARAIHHGVWLFGAAMWLTRDVNHRSRCITFAAHFYYRWCHIPGEQTAAVEYFRSVPHCALKVAGEIPALQCRDREGPSLPLRGCGASRVKRTSVDECRQ